MSVDLNISQGFRSFSRLCESQSAIRLRPSLLPFLLNLLLTIFLSVSKTVSAQPSITSLQLSKSSSEFTILSGTGFGQFTGEVLSWDDFDEKALSSLLHQAPAIDGNTWLAGGKAQAVIDKSFSLSGSQSVKLDSSQAKGGFFGWKQKGFYDRLYINYWQRTDGELAKGDQQLQVFGNNKLPLLALGLDKCWQLTGKLLEQQEVNIRDNCWPQIAGKFQHWELWIDLRESVINARLDNLPITSFKARNMPADGINEVRFVQTGSAWFDDVYIANTQARVEACNAPEYAQCSRHYLQYVAAENWSETKIKLRLHNLRALRGESIYLYIIDSRGQVSNGIAIARPVIKAN